MRCAAQWCEDAEPEVVAAFQATLSIICAAGGEVVPVVLPELEQLRCAHLATISTESALSMKPALTVHPRTFISDSLAVKQPHSVCPRLLRACQLHFVDSLSCACRTKPFVCS